MASLLKAFYEFILTPDDKEIDVPDVENEINAYWLKRNLS